MEQQYTRITTSLFEAIQKVTTGVSEQKQELLAEKSQDVEEANIYVPPASHVSPSKPNMSKEDEKNRKASLLIDKIRSFRQLKQDYKEKGNLERHREFHNKLHDADKEYRKLGFQSLLRKDDHMVEEVELEEAMTPEFEKKFAETPKGVEVHMKHKETGKIVKNKFIGTHSAVAAAKKHIADMEKKGYEVHAKKLIEQEDVELEEDFSKMDTPTLKKWIATRERNAMGGNLSKKRSDQYDQAQTELKNRKSDKMANEEVEQTDEAQTSAAARLAKAKMKMSHQASTTMKHISNPTPGEAKAAKDIKPGIAGYRDRIAMLKSAEARGGLKKEEAEQFDETIIKEDLNFEVPEQFTFKDYLTAVTSLVGSELEEHQIVAVAYEAFRTQEEDIILEELTRDDLKQKMKAHMDAGHQISGEKFSMKDGKPYGEYVVTDKETGVRRKYIHHGTTRRVENMGSRTKKDAKAND